MENIGKYKVNLVTGFRKDQYYSISAEEAHKAYWLFLNPSERGIFDNGLAIIGKNIEDIVPDYHGTMGWNASHVIDSDDWNEINSKGIKQRIESILSDASRVAKSEMGAGQLGDPLSKVLRTFPKSETPKEISDAAKSLADGMKMR